MDFSIFDKINEVVKTVFETPVGVIILFVAFLLISLIVAAILEKRTKKQFKDRDED
ncbi:MAG: hypothetical protein Q4E88_03120 [Coriobacteriia bacterium]|nr:hypothetical protein [Coriobacteriia bacterium]